MMLGTETAAEAVAAAGKTASAMNENRMTAVRFFMRTSPGSKDDIPVLPESYIHHEKRVKMTAEPEKNSF